MLRSKIAIICLFAMSSASLQAQEATDADRKKMNVGFIVGGNYSFLTTKASNPTTQMEITNKPGIGLGIGAEFQLFKGLYAAPSAIFMMGGSEVNFANRDLKEVYEVMPFAVGLNANFQYKFSEGVNQPYVILGGKVDIPVQKQEETTDYGNSPNWGLNVGVGLSHWFKPFMLAPELVYSHGFSNINNDPSISADAGLYMHQISLRFKFMD
jgi:hypothetical protein